MMPNIVLATASVAFEERLRNAFGGSLNGELQRVWSEDYADGDHSRVVSELSLNAPGVVTLGPNLSAETALALAQSFDREHPEISVVIVADPTPTLWQDALRAGVRDIVAPGADPAELRAAIERAMDTAQRRRHNLTGGDNNGEPGGRVITVLSPKGGSGKTTVATNLAVGLARQAPNQVVLVDLDLQFGDVATALQLQPEHTMFDAANAPSLDTTTLKVFLTAHASGLYALCAPDSPAKGESITSEKVARVLDLLAQEFAYVVVDTSAGLHENTLAAIEESSDLIALCAMDVPSVRSLHKELTALDELGMTNASRHFVLNRADSRVGLAIEDVQGLVGMEVHVQIPSSRNIPLSTNQGMPVLTSDQRSPVARQLQQMVNRFTETTAGSRPGGGFRLFKKEAR